MGVPKGGDFRTAQPSGWLESRDGALVLALHVQPGARRTAVVGLHGERLKVAVMAPPADGRANAALLQFLAKQLGVPKSALELLSGESSRDKRVAVHAPLDALQATAALLR